MSNGTLLPITGIPERDLGFEIAVLTRIEQRRFRRGMMANVALGVSAIVLLALVMPQIELGWARDKTGTAMLAGALCALPLVWQWGLMRRA